MPSLSSSFRDPNGQLFIHSGTLYRQINAVGASDYRLLMDSGLYACLANKSWLIDHEEVPHPHPQTESEADFVLRPRMLPYISYPYEWSFDQLKDAALLTLDIQIAAVEHGLSLKDASAFNVQFDGHRPIFIDTLSFEKYVEGKPWVAYGQFCRHFLAPLALASKSDQRLRKLFLAYIDGIPLDLASALLPKKTLLQYSLLSHIHLHAKAQARYAREGQSQEATKQATPREISKPALLALLGSLRSAVHKQALPKFQSEWGNYYRETNYSESATDNKAALVDSYLATIPGPINMAQDLGANNGQYSRIAAKYAQLVISQDIDSNAVNANYCMLKDSGPDNILPLELDLTAPTPAIGWANAERDSFMQRPRADVVLALALIHHLAISNNLPLHKVADLLAAKCHWLIIEFIPKEDSRVRTLLATRPDIFPDYTQASFEAVFSEVFELHLEKPVDDSFRTLYLMESRNWKQNQEIAG